MYSKFEIKNFKCFDSLSFPSINHINLISGLNNVGKTALLEAIFIHLGRTRAELALRIDKFRGIESYSVKTAKWEKTGWEYLFHNFNEKEEIIIEGYESSSNPIKLVIKSLNTEEDYRQFNSSIQNKPITKALSDDSSKFFTEKILNLRYYRGRNTFDDYYVYLTDKGINESRTSPPPPFPGFFFYSKEKEGSKIEADRLTGIIKSNKEKLIIKSLQTINDKISDIRILQQGDQPLISVKLESNIFIPVYLMGGGMSKLLTYSLGILNAENGVVLIDEFENGLHWSALKNIWNNIIDLAITNNTQLFITTHSYECINSGIDAINQDNERYFSYHRLQKDNQGISKLVTYNVSDLKESIKMKLEIR